MSHRMVRAARRPNAGIAVAAGAAVAIACLLRSSPLAAQETAAPVRVWQGPDGGNWNVPANWTGNAVPVSTADAIIDSSGGPGIDSNQAVRLLKVGETSGGIGSTLTITDGGVLTSYAAAVIGNGAGSEGTVTIIRPGSLWKANTTFALQVGANGTGALNIRDGGALNLGTGSLTLAALGSASTGTLDVDGGIANMGVLQAGVAGQATLRVQNGGVLTSTTSALGLVASAPAPLATATVTGAGSRWSTAVLTVGSRSDGRLDITAGGHVTSSAGTIANADTRLATTGTGYVTVDASRWDITAGNLVVGGVRDGTLDILNGSAVTISDRLGVGSVSGTGRVLVDHSALVTGPSETVEIGGGSGNQAGAGFLTLRNGATADFNIGVLNISGRSGSVPGTVVVEGEGTRLSSTGTVSISNNTPGSLTIRDGATMNTAALGAGGSATGNATMVVDDATWNISGSARMGRSGFSDLLIQNGGTVNVAGGVEMAINPTGRPTIRIGGTGGTFTAPLVTGGEYLMDGTLAPAQGIASLIFEHSNTAQQFTAPIEGNFTVSQAGPGTTILTADSTYTGTTTISAGTLQLGNGGLTGQIHSDIAIAAGGTLALNRSDLTDTPFTLGQAISGAGGLRNIGPGTTIMDGINSYTGETAVEAGEVIARSLASTQITVHDGARLSSHAQGTNMSGAVIVHDGGTLNPVGLMTVGSLVLESGAILDYRLGVPTDAPGSATNDRIAVTGNLTLGGARLDVTDQGGFSQGVYRIFDYGGALTGNASGLSLGVFPASLHTTDFTVQTSIGGQVNLVVSQGGLANQWWDGTQLAGNGVIDGGDGVWRLDRSNWTNSDGTANATWEPGFAIFAGQAGIATLEQDIPVGGMQFITDGYRIEPGNGFVLRGDPDTIVRVDTGVTATIAAPFTDGASAATLIKSGFGTLALAGTNTQHGGTRIETGILQISADVNLGSAAAPLEFMSGVLHTTASMSSVRPVAIEQRGILRTDSGTTLTLNGVIDGDGELIKQDGGTLVLTGANRYMGGTTVAAGVLEIGADSALGDPDGPLILGGEDRILRASDALGMPGGVATNSPGTLRLRAQFDLAATRVIRLDAPGGIIDTAGFTTTLRQAVVGAGSLTKAGAGTLVLSADNLYSGGTTIDEGTLQLGNGGASGSVVGPIHNDGTLVFARTDDLIHDGPINGAGQVVKQGANTLALTGSSTYAGPTTVEQGRLRADGVLASVVHVANRAVLDGGGTVGGIVNSGRVAPGTSIGTLTVTGDFAQHMDGVLAVDLDDTGGFDKLVVGGKAQLDGAVEYVPDPASLFPEDLKYTYLTAAGGVEGTFTSTTQEYGGVIFETITNADNVQVQITRRPLPDNVVDPEAGGENLAACLGSLEQLRDGELDATRRSMLSTFVGASAQDFLAKANAACPRDTSVLASAVHGSTLTRIGQVNARIAEIHGAVEDPGSAGLFDSYRLREGVGLWLRGAYQESNGDQRDVSRLGFDSHDYAFTLGVDAAVAAAGLVGAYLSHDELQVSYRGTYHDSAQTALRGWTAGLYGSWWSERRWFAHGAVEYGWHDVESHRLVGETPMDPQASGERDARAFAAAIGTGYALKSAAGWLIQPQLDITYDRFEDSAYAETGGGLLNLSYADMSAATLRTEAGITVRRSLAITRDAPEITAVWLFVNGVYDKALDNRAVSASFESTNAFQAHDDSVARAGVHYGIGLEHTWNNNSALRLLFDGTQYGEISSGTASIQFRMQF